MKGVNLGISRASARRAPQTRRPNPTLRCTHEISNRYHAVPLEKRRQLPIETGWPIGVLPPASDPDNETVRSTSTWAEPPSWNDKRQRGKYSLEKFVPLTHESTSPDVPPQDPHRDS